LRRGILFSDAEILEETGEDVPLLVSPMTSARSCRASRNSMLTISRPEEARRAPSARSKRLRGALQGRVLARVDGEDGFGFVGHFSQERLFDPRLQVVEALARQGADRIAFAGSEGCCPSVLFRDKKAGNIFGQLDFFHRRRAGGLRRPGAEVAPSVGRARARRLPSISTGSVESRCPAVSMSRSGRPRTLQGASIKSRVVPGLRRQWRGPPQQRIQQARFSDVRFADDHGQRALLQDAAQRRGA